MDSQHATGTAIGGLLGMIKAFMTVKFLGVITIGLLFDTIILAGVGAIVGWLVTEFLKWVKNKIK